MTYKKIYDAGMTIDPEIGTYQIEIRGRIVTKLNLQQYVPIARYDVIAASYEEACDFVRKYENNGRREHELVKYTMRMA